MSFTEFCCKSGGSNLNAGTRTGSSTEPGVSPDVTYASGSWVASTGVFTVASGNPLTDGVAVDDFASVYADGASVTGFVGRVTAVSDSTVTVSLTARLGTAPADGASNRTLRIGGAWQGPNTSSAFPFNAITGACTNASGNAPRVNFKNDQTYSRTSAITHTLIGPVMFQGYSANYGDGGKATIDGGGSGASYVLFTLSAAGAAYTAIVDLCFNRNGATGQATLVNGSGDDRAMFYRCVFSGSRGIGLSGSGVECEAFGNNLSNTTNSAGLQTLIAGNYFVRCISHDNVGSNSDGFYTQAAGSRFIDCISDSNGRDGFRVNNASGASILNCVAHGNGANGINQLSLPGVMLIENCIFANNGAFGISLSGQLMMAQINNCAFRSNTSGETNAVGGATLTGNVTLTADPFVDAPNGDFDLNSTAGGGAACRAAGRGLFQQTAAGYAGTLGFPDIGASQSQGSGGGGLRFPRAMSGGYSA